MNWGISMHGRRRFKIIFGHLVWSWRDIEAWVWVQISNSLTLSQWIHLFKSLFMTTRCLYGMLCFCIEALSITPNTWHCMNHLSLLGQSCHYWLFVGSTQHKPSESIGCGLSYWEDDPMQALSKGKRLGCRTGMALVGRNMMPLFNANASLQMNCQ